MRGCYHCRRLKQPPCSSSIVALQPLLLPVAALLLLWVQLLLLLVVADAVGGDADSQPPIGLPGCPTSCGYVSVPYPFGLEPGCYLDGFNLTCDAMYSEPQLFLSGIDDDSPAITRISVEDNTARFVDPQAFGKYQALSGSIFFVGDPTMYWVVASTVLQGWNQTRAGNATCPTDLGTTACHSSHSTCRTWLRYYDRKGYICQCDDGYEGNAYLSDGCTDIDESKLPGKCFGNCKNLPGNYLCQCPEGTTGNPYIQNGCAKPKTGLIIGLGVGSGAILLFLVLITTYMTNMIMTRKKRMRLRFFNQNHGQLLQQLVSQRADIGERMILTLEELERATNNFDKSS